MSGGLPRIWNATPDECARTYPCDRIMPQADHRYYRAVDVDAPPALTFRWLQQLRVAPYSYDWADNFLLPSPGRLSPRAASIAPGQRMMHLFVIAELEPGRSITLVPGSRIGAALFGALCGTYTVEPRGARGSRLFVHVNASYAPFPARLLARAMPWIDFAMMRKQLLRLKHYAERDARRAR